ncbi:hypothetical protein [Nonomuraea insulae]|uniref:CNNM transmembrane domain-containing protein n=1 Tax=Nonomuraea insulae TaxID=1616787 RepID=A0ABW1CNS7_9ACTN
MSRDAAFILFVLLAEMVPNLIPVLGNDRIRMFAVLGACSYAPSHAVRTRPRLLFRRSQLRILQGALLHPRKLKQRPRPAAVWGRCEAKLNQPLSFSRRCAEHWSSRLPDSRGPLLQPWADLLVLADDDLQHAQVGQH